jgi:hypothetical protein
VLALPIRHHWPYQLGMVLARVGSARGQGVTVTGVRVALGDNRKYLQRFALILEYVLHSEYSDQSEKDRLSAVMDRARQRYGNPDPGSLEDMQYSRYVCKEWLHGV